MKSHNMVQQILDRTSPDKLQTMSEETKWQEMRLLRSNSWKLTKHLCSLLYDMEIDYRSNGKTTTQFLIQAKLQLGLSTGYVSSLSTLRQNKMLMSLSDDLAGFITLDAMILLSREKTKMCKNYKKATKKTMDSIMSNIQVTYGMVRSWLYPSRESRQPIYYTAKLDGIEVIVYPLDPKVRPVHIRKKLQQVIDDDLLSIIRTKKRSMGPDTNPGESPK